MPRYRKDVNTHRHTGGLAPVTPHEIDKVRRSALDVVRKNIPIVRLVLKGERKWSNQQVRLFSIMLNKVMPDLHHSLYQHTHEHKNIDQLSIDELNKIASQALANAPDAELVDVTPDEEPPEELEDESADPDAPASRPASPSDPAGTE